jgi:mRNA-degrading endonuclease RelE of RelBE toxin-antitoxin system
MGKIEKQLRKIPLNPRERVFAAIAMIMARNFSALDRRRLQGHECIFRIRIGNYRIIYFDDGDRIVLKDIVRRSDTTYRDF